MPSSSHPDHLEAMIDVNIMGTLYCVTRPRSWRMLTTSYRPTIEASWG